MSYPFIQNTLSSSAWPLGRVRARAKVSYIQQVSVMAGVVYKTLVQLQISVSNFIYHGSLSFCERSIYF